MANAKIVDDTTALVTWPVDVWFNGSRTFKATLDFGGRADHHDHTRSVVPVPGPRTRRQRVAEAGGACGAGDARAWRRPVRPRAAGRATAAGFT